MTASVRHRPIPPAPSARVARTLAGELGWYGLMWLGIVLAAVVVGNIGTEVLDTASHTSVGSATLGLPRYVLLAGGVVVATSHLPLHLGLGVTRRDFLAGAVPALVGVAVVAGVAATVVLALEGVVYDALGWPHLADPGDGRDAPVAVDLRETAVHYPVLYVLHVASGLVGAAAFMRGGWVLGTLAIPLAAVPAATGEVLVGGNGPGHLLSEWLGFGAPSLPITAALGAAVAVASLAVAVRLLRGVLLDAGDVGWWR